MGDKQPAKIEISMVESIIFDPKMLLTLSGFLNTTKKNS
jgi:hypothetical protein